MATNGGGQLVIINAVDSAGAVSPLANLHHYDPGTTDTANIYSNEDLDAGNVLAQPFISDSAGRFIFYANGDFDFVIKDAADAVTLDTIDDWHISKGESCTLSYGEALPAANLLSKGKLFPVIDSSDVLRGFYVQQHTSYKAVALFNADGDQIFDSVITESMPVYNVKHASYGAVGDGATDDKTKIQAAIDAIEASTYGGILYFPAGQYNISDELVIADTNIVIMGDGPNISTIYQTGAANGFTITQASHIYKVVIKDLTMLTEDTTGAGNAIDATWITGSITRNFWLQNVNIAPAGAGADYWGKGVVLDIPFSPLIEGLSYSGRSVTTSSADAIEITAADGTIYIAGSYIIYAASGISIIGASEPAVIDGNVIDYVNVGIEVAPSSAKAGFIITNNTITSITRGITLSKATDSIIAGNALRKLSSSTDTYYGVELIDTNADCSVSNNNIRDHASATGIFYGITHTSGTDIVYDSNHIKVDGSSPSRGIQIAAGQTGFTIIGNRIIDIDEGVNVNTGASDNYVITNNNLKGCTTKIIDGGTGDDKLIANNSPTNDGVTTETAKLTTTDATFTVIWSSGTLQDNSVAAIWVDVTSRKSDNTHHSMHTEYALHYRAGGAATIEGATTSLLAIVSSTQDVRIIAIANTVEVQVQGVAAETHYWKADVKMITEVT